MTLPRRLNKHPEYRLESDAGPEGIGSVVFDRDGNMMAYTSYRLPWVRDRENKFQNQQEYIEVHGRQHHRAGMDCKSQM